MQQIVTQLGNPEALFYWGPTRANPLYMGDFLEAEEQNFINMRSDPALPNPPKSLNLFHNGQTVWLIPADDFAEFVSKTFQAYQQAGRFKADLNEWREAVRELDSYMQRKDYELEKINQLFTAAWRPSLVAEFALYGAEAALKKLLSRFDEAARQKIWRGFTLPDEPDFIQRLDRELFNSKDPQAMAARYPWIQDGYSGAYPEAKSYFEQRLQAVKPELTSIFGSRLERSELTKKHDLTKEEVATLDLARQLAAFMDERKAWMMRSRSYIAQAAQRAGATATNRTLHQLATKQQLQGCYGWWYDSGKIKLLSEADAKQLWDSYVDYGLSEANLQGTVACDGGQTSLNGLAKVVMTPTESVLPGQILIIPATTPSYVPLMRAAAGLVTDHGGILSHAAIVAREFGLPCIVGTHHATKIIRDGDSVEMDLKDGTIRLKGSAL